MKNKILIFENGGIAKTKNGELLGNESSGKFLTNLQNNGYRVTYAARQGNTTTKAVIYNFNLNKHHIKSSIIHGNRPKCYWALFKLFFLILTHRYIYIFYPGGPSKIVSKLCKILGKKYGVYVRGNGLYVSDKDNENIHKPFEFSENFILKDSSFLITVSDKLKENLGKIYPHREKIKIIKSMLNWDLKDIYLRTDYLNKKKLNILFIGSLIELKGIDELIEVSKILDKKNINYQLKIIGDGVLLPDLLEKQRNNEISQNVLFSGAVYEKNILSAEYKDASIFLFPSRNEGFPRVLYEAMINSLPIFTTFVGGIPGIMKDKINCIKIPVRDPKGQAKALIEYMYKPEILQKTAENGQKTVTQILTERNPHHEVLINCIENLNNKKRH